jgi:phage terminase large subunit-like protein
LRRFTTAYNEVPRKQGKTFEEAIVGVYATFFEGEAGADGYYIATKEKQAKLGFSNAKKLVQTSGLASRIKCNAANLHREATECKLEPLGSDSDTTDGLNPHFVGVDELHAFKTRGLLDVMESATGARLNPLFFQITTAGNDPVSPCGDQHDYACKILDGVLEDDRRHDPVLRVHRARRPGG